MSSIRSITSYTTVNRRFLQSVKTFFGELPAEILFVIVMNEIVRRLA